ncbi:type VII secretion-associated serine protease mycosin [Kribbella speibonae]|uniref:type VII secretion-associated serine protease mycosin n=1 Tax=Kribbella speibonae TaxID=1572660 RepID=UPI001EDEE044|nr:type VII secretion-associated serine protease mycosin [Kribbella speibonae]
MRSHAKNRFGAAAVAAALAFGPAATVVPAYAAPPKGACRNAEPAHPVQTLLPWAQQLLMPQRAWPFSTGSGVTVAVIDSGVDADHPQLRRPGKVLPGHDFYLKGKLPGNYDCISHGTGVAGIIAADGRPGVGFEGIAPGARILPVRVSERETDNTGNTEEINPNILAKGIKYAVDARARVINLSLAGFRDERPVRQAIAYAVAHDVVVVAAVGNGQGSGGDGKLPSYPASYPGVIGVGAIDNAGARLTASQVGPYVDLVAPGGSVLAPTRVAGHAYQDGTSFAAPFVAGTAALVRAAWPKLTAAQVAQRLMATADPARGGTGSQEYGAGIVDPYRAVTEGMAVGAAKKLPAAHVPPPDEHALALAAWWQSRGSLARSTAVLAAGAMAVVVLLACLMTAGHRRRWAVGRSAIARTAKGEPTDLPPEFLFTRPERDA